MDPQVTIGFSTKHENLLSRTIRWFTRSKFSHTWVRYYHPLYRMNVVVEADLRGIVEVPYDEYILKNDSIVEMVPPPGLDVERGLPTLGRTLGRGYDLGSLVGRAWVFFLRWLGHKARNPFADTTKDACVESVLRFVSEVDSFFASIDPETESPEGLYQALAKRGWKPVHRQETPSAPIMATG